jgi:hypothetical protein
MGALGVHLAELKLVTVPADASSHMKHHERLYQSIPFALAAMLMQVSMGCLAVLWDLGPRFTWLLVVFHFGLRASVVPLAADFGPFNLFGLAVVAFHLGLGGKCAQVMRSYWMLFAALVMLLTYPGVVGVQFRQLPFHWFERLRFVGVECIFFLFVASGALACKDPFRIGKCIDAWSLYAYLTHVFAYRALSKPRPDMGGPGQPPPGPPYMGESWGAFFTYASVIVFFALLRLRQFAQPPRPASEEVFHSHVGV